MRHGRERVDEEDKRVQFLFANERANLLIAAERSTLHCGDIKVSVRCAPPNGCVSGVLVSTIDSGHLGALYGGKAEEAALAG